jgi:hypothetical protein
MYCVKCGTELLLDAKFCTSCGSNVDTVNVVPDIQGVGDNATRVAPAQPTKKWRLDLIVGLVAVALLAGGLYWYQVERNIVRAPEYKVGDKWTFEYPPWDYSGTLFSKSEIERMRREHEPEATYEVTKGNDLELYAKKVSGKLDGFEGLPLALWKSKDTENEIAYPFPLHPGKTWGTQHKNTMPQGSITSITEYKVGEWETITVPAGTFRAIPIIRTSKSFYELKSESPSYGRSTVWVEWYAPDAKNDIKSTHNDEVISQLKAYTVR